MQLIKRQNIVWQWISWQFFEIPKDILNGWRNFLLFNLNYFSISLLFKTLFSPWRKYQWSYGRGFNIKRYAEVFFSNLLSRVIGAILRTVVIIIGLLIQIFIILAGTIIFLGWLILPFFLIFGLYYGFKILS